jgi:predicted transcriptional regulator
MNYDGARITVRMTEDALPTEAELAILAVLWKRGPRTVREVHEALGREEGKGAGYTTTLKQLQVMAAKGLVSRDESARSHVYTARVAEGRTKRQLVKDLLERVFDGSAAKLALQALSIKPASKEELAELRRLLNDKKGEDR